MSPFFFLYSSRFNARLDRWLEAWLNMAPDVAGGNWLAIKWTKLIRIIWTIKMWKPDPKSLDSMRQNYIIFNSFHQNIFWIFF